MNDIKLPTEDELRSMAERFATLFPEGQQMETLGLLSYAAADTPEGLLRSKTGLSAIIDHVIQPYAQLTDCELFDECDCRHCKWCGGYLTDGHKVLWNGPMGWGVCNIDCAKFYAAEFIVANKEAVLY